MRVDPADGILERFSLLWIIAEIAIPMFWNFKAQRKSAQMGNFTQELDRRFRVAIFQFAVGWTHAAHRVQPALGTFGGARCLPLPNVQQEMLPARAHAALANVISILM